MSAASPKIPDAKVQDKAAEKAHEPSMEEILASIRRIIADDQAAKPPEPTPEPDFDDVLDLAEVAEPVVRPRPVQAAPLPPAPKPEPKPEPVALDFDTIDFDAIDFVEPEPEPEPPPPPPPRPAAVQPPPRPAAVQPPPQPQPVRQAAPPPPPPAPEAETLVSPATDATVNSAFNLLAHTVLSQNARTLEDLVKDMLRPMLKAWLDDNLPAVVERLVRAEIERVSRGR